MQWGTSAKESMLPSYAGNGLLLEQNRPRFGFCP
jgi:hypothetical protein